METHTCVYCGAPATYRFKNGNWCCSVNRQSCPTYRAKIAQSVADRHAEAKVKYGSALFSHQHSVAKTGIAATTKYPSRGDHICVYCGGHADYQLKDGRWCCHEKKGSCPEIRRKNSEGCKNPFKTEDEVKVEVGPVVVFRGIKGFQAPEKVKTNIMIRLLQSKLQLFEPPMQTDERELGLGGITPRNKSASFVRFV